MVTLPGDRLLQLVAERLGKVVRKSDVLVRWEEKNS